MIAVKESPQLMRGPLGGHLMSLLYPSTMTNEISSFRAVAAAAGFILLGKLLYDYFSRSPRIVNEPDVGIRQLTRLRVHSALIALGSVALAPLGFTLGVPLEIVLIVFGIAVAAALVCLVCTFLAVIKTGRVW